MPIFAVSSVVYIMLLPMFFCIFIKRIHNILIFNVNFLTTGYSLRHVQQARVDRRLEAIESSVSYLAEILFLLEHAG